MLAEVIGPSAAEEKWKKQKKKPNDYKEER